jgi:LuxR family maltose regulon positive regulatory protein
MVMQQSHHNQCEGFHFKRPRLYQLFKEAKKYPLVVVCAGAGYGKTSAIHDFASEYKAVTVWMQLSERDNVNARFWENFTHTVAQVNVPFASAINKLGFPDTKAKLTQYMALSNELVVKKERIIVLDDFHYIEDPHVIRFLEECLILKMPPGTSVFLISRTTPPVNNAGLVSRDLIFNISENDLRFTENELSQYFKSMGLSPKLEHQREIMQDTEGWVFAINLIVRSYQKAPGYGGYLRSAMKTSIFKLMETEIWDGISRQLQNFLIRLSLIDHLSVELINLLVDSGEECLLAELDKQNAYMRRDNYINAYLIHPLFLEFLANKQNTLPKEQIQKTYSIAGAWCNKNGYSIDALSYFEKIQDYEAIVNVLTSLPSQIPFDIAKYASEILDRAPEKAFDIIDSLAAIHISTYMCHGLWEKSASLAVHYENKFLKLPEKSAFRKNALSALYNCWGYLRGLMCIMDDTYDFDIYFEKFCEHFASPINYKRLYNHCPGPWIIAVGSCKKGEPEKFIESLKHTTAMVAQKFNGLKTGEYELANGEIRFYQGDFNTAKTFIIRSLEYSRKYKQFEIIHRALFCMLRLSIAQGDYLKAEKTIKEIKSQLEEDQYINRYTNYDISIAWYYCILSLPEKAPDWLKDNFSPYVHAAFTENFENQIKALFHFITRDYPPLLSYIQEMKQRESFLFGRIEMLALEACVYYKMKDKKQAFSSLEEAYNAAFPNEIIIPFMELGKDMRTLASAALKEPSSCKIPKAWLENINRKSASYAKQQVHLATHYRQANLITNKVALSAREAEVLADLSHGLSRSEIANTRGLSINTVKMVINNVYMKLGAENLADAIRIAAEKKIV